MAEFIEQNLSPEQVKEKLLACANTRDEIRSTVYHQETQVESPVIAAARTRAKKGE